MIKKIAFVIFATILAFSASGCMVDHDDGVCDVKGCDRTFGVIRYDKEHELCIEHAIEAGFDAYD